jgi:hypothetical protein
MQYKITCHEEYLEALDLQHIQRPEEIENNSFNDHDVRRTDVLNKLQGLLKEYDDLILSHRQLRSSPEAEGYQIMNLKNFFHNIGDTDGDGNGPIAPKETEFVNQGGDLVALVQKSKTLLRRGLDKLESWRTLFIFKEKTEKAHYYQKWYTSKTTTYQDDAKMDRYLNIIITVIGIGVLLGPLWLLKEQSAETTRLVTISVSLTIFTILLNILTVARTFDSLAAAAAYETSLIK